MGYELTKEEFIAGWISGMVGITIGHPFETVKVKQQISQNTIPFIIKDTLKHQGILGFFRGLAVPVITAGMVNSTFFGVYGNVLRITHIYTGVKDINQDPHLTRNVLFAGFWGGLVQCIVSNPIEVIKIRLQTRREYILKKLKAQNRTPTSQDLKISMWGILKEIYKKEGFHGYYKGLLLLVVRDTPSFGIYMYTFETLERALSNDRGFGTDLSRCVAGACAGIMSWIFVIPIDVCKSKIQSAAGDKEITGWQCLKDLYKSGLKNSMKGTSILIIRSIPLNASLFWTYKKCMELLQPNENIPKSK